MSDGMRITQFFHRRMDRRDLLCLGAKAVWRIGATVSMLEGLTACYRAPGTARDQLIFFSRRRNCNLD